MFERFTTSARQAVLAARQESIELGQPMLGTEHLLIALTADTGTGGLVLRGAGLTPDRVRSDVRRLVGDPAPLLDEKDAEALRSVGIDLDAVLARIEASFGKEALLAQPSGKRGWFGRRGRSSRLAPSSRAKKVLELSLREAIRMQQKEINSGHLLLGLLREGDGLAARILVDAGLDLADLRVRTEAAMRPAA
jgi:ATP-dependent Clp protease ATP-binding subunit ClpA